MREDFCFVIVFFVFFVGLCFRYVGEWCLVRGGGEWREGRRRSKFFRVDF